MRLVKDAPGPPGFQSGPGRTAPPNHHHHPSILLSSTAFLPFSQLRLARSGARLTAPSTDSSCDSCAERRRCSLASLSVPLTSAVVNLLRVKANQGYRPGNGPRNTLAASTHPLLPADGEATQPRWPPARALAAGSFDGTRAIQRKAARPSPEAERLVVTLVPPHPLVPSPQGLGPQQTGLAWSGVASSRWQSSLSSLEDCSLVKSTPSNLISRLLLSQTEEEEKRRRHRRASSFPQGRERHQT